MNPHVDDDNHLLQGYVSGRSESAFRELVERHLRMVLATARRLAGGDAHLAEDVAQAVFADLAKKAATLPADVVLGGWLHRHTCYLALNAARAEHRRRQRESIAMELQTLHDTPTHDAAWQKLAPVLDAALNGLPASDRDAIVLRYLQQQDLRGVGDRLGVSEDAAQKRVARALEKLRAILLRRGVTFPSALLAATLETGAAGSPAAAGLAAEISSAALGQAAVSGSFFSSMTNLLAFKPVLATVAAIALGVFAWILLARDEATAPSIPDALPTTQISPAVRGVEPRQPVAVAADAGNAVAAAPAAEQPLPISTAAPGAPGLFGPTIAANDAPAAAAPASAAPDDDASADPSRPVRAITVSYGQLSMTTTYADGSVITEPYNEPGASVSISPGDEPGKYVVTFRSLDDGKILARIVSVPEAPPDLPAPAASVNGAKATAEPGSADQFESAF